MHRGFSLIEILVVVSIIAILIALLAVALAKPRDQQKQLEASEMLQAMGTALLKMKQDLGIETVLGKNDKGSKDKALFDTGELFKELCPSAPAFAGFTPRFNATRTVYMEFKQHHFKNGAVADPWGNPYRYLVYVIDSQQWPYEVEALYSTGPDGRPHTSDDVVREISRSPIRAHASDPTKPELSRGEIEEVIGWIDKPGAWR
ncbi:MAG TPA: prepilin-type N-terminal cleavage/methylation domain-containing protein [Planctomycetota bacterium]|nr:prepilin-type N-terminal cleavage/methylation domain-containing protein [Planctomycetota bacterium]